MNTTMNKSAINGHSKINHGNIQTTRNLPTNLFEQNNTPIQNRDYPYKQSNMDYKEHYVAKYFTNGSTKTSLKTHIDSFIKSEDFSLLCCEFYILLANFKENNHFNVKELSNKLARRALIYIDKTQNNKSSNALSLNQNAFISMMEEVFINLSKNKLNKYAVNTMLHNLNVEKCLHEEDRLPYSQLVLVISLFSIVDQILGIPKYSLTSIFYFFAFTAIILYFGYKDLSTSIGLCLGILATGSSHGTDIFYYGTSWFFFLRLCGYNDSAKSKTSLFLNNLIEKYDFNDKPEKLHKIQTILKGNNNKIISSRCTEAIRNVSFILMTARFSIDTLYTIVNRTAHESSLKIFYYFGLYIRKVISSFIVGLFMKYIFLDRSSLEIVVSNSGNKYLDYLLNCLIKIPKVEGYIIRSDILNGLNQLKEQKSQKISLAKKLTNKFNKVTLSPMDNYDIIIRLLKNQIIMPYINVEIVSNVQNSNKHSENNLFEYGATDYDSVSSNIKPIYTNINRKMKHISNNSLQSLDKVYLAQPEATNSDLVIFLANTINKKYPSQTIYYKDLKYVEGRHGNSYFTYWDEKFLYSNRYSFNINILKKIFDESTEVKAKDNSSGIKRLNPSIRINGLNYLYELKSVSIPSRIYGFIHPASSINKFIVLFSCFDNTGNLSNH